MAANKGERVQIVRGKKGKGVTGVVFWVGPDRFDPQRVKVGVNGDDGEKYWVYEDYTIASTQTQAPPAAPRVAKGDRVVWREGHDSGEGVAFWVGASKQGPGLRVGVDLGGGAKRFFALNDVTTVVPYVLHGADPATWDAPEGWLARSVDICFARKPAAPEREAIAERVHADLRPGESVLRCGSYLWLPLAPATNEAALAAAQAWLDEVDAIVAIEDAVFLAASADQFGADVSARRPQWSGFLITGGSYKADVVDPIFADVRARRGGGGAP